MVVPRGTAVWKQIRAPFVLPEAIHSCRYEDYENFDVDAAGCRVCGKIHYCNTGGCIPSETNGHVACMITGFCIRNLVYSNEEFVDTVSVMPQGYQRQLQGVDSSQIEFWVEDVISGHVDVLREEIERNRVRVEMIFVRILKHYKTSHLSLNVVDVFTCLINATKNLRQPVLLGEMELKQLSDLCSNEIIVFCGRFFYVSAVPSSVKLHGFIVGLLYLMRKGLVINDSIRILPAIQILNLVLPSEAYVKNILNVTAKIMTETENIVKKALKNLTLKQLRDVGF